MCRNIISLPRERIPVVFSGNEFGVCLFRRRVAGFALVTGLRPCGSDGTILWTSTLRVYADCRLITEILYRNPAFCFTRTLFLQVSNLAG